jgi:hypothetical protein
LKSVQQDSKSAQQDSKSVLHLSKSVQQDLIPVLNVLGNDPKIEPHNSDVPLSSRRMIVTVSEAEAVPKYPNDEFQKVDGV